MLQLHGHAVCQQRAPAGGRLHVFPQECDRQPLSETGGREGLYQHEVEGVREDRCSRLLREVRETTRGGDAAETRILRERHRRTLKSAQTSR